MLKYSGQSAGAGAWVAGLAAAGAALFREDVVNVKQLSWLQAGAGVLGVASKAPQIYTVWREGGTGQLSAFAVSAPLSTTTTTTPSTPTFVSTLSAKNTWLILCNRSSTTSSAP